MIYRYYFYLAAFASLMTMPVTALAEREGRPLPGNGQGRILTHAANSAGFYTALPAVNSRHLADLLSLYHASLEKREQEIARYLDENQMDAADMLITVIMPGGLIYAAAKKADLEEARSELNEITEDRIELSRDLVLMQTLARKLAMTRLE